MLFCYFNGFLQFVKPSIAINSSLLTSKRLRRLPKFNNTRSRVFVCIFVFCHCHRYALSKSVSKGFGFYKLTSKETVVSKRRVVLKPFGRNMFIYDFSNTSLSIGHPSNRQASLTWLVSSFVFVEDILQKLLRLPNTELVEIDPKSYPKFEIYVECPSNTKLIKVCY